LGKNCDVILVTFYGNDVTEMTS